MAFNACTLPLVESMANNVGLTFSVGDTTPRFTIVLSKTIRMGDTEYHS